MDPNFIQSYQKYYSLRAFHFFFNTFKMKGQKKDDYFHLE